MRQVYVNGAFVAENDAVISVFDRGFLFADGVYEVTSVLGGKLIDFDGHMARLRRSLDELAIGFTVDREQLLAIHRKLVELNAVDEGLIYLQVTRGAADRDFLYPDPPVQPSLVLFTQAKPLIKSQLAERGQVIVTVDDLRWARCDIKTVQLLYPSMVKTRAKQLGADDGWLVKDGLVTEGSSNNAFIVTDDGTIVTRQLSSDILHGITRKAVMDCAMDLDLTVAERPFGVDEAKAAREAFSTSASSFVVPVISIDGQAIGDGTPGPVAARLREAYILRSQETAI